MVELTLERQAVRLDRMTFNAPENKNWSKWICRIPSGQVDPKEDSWADLPLIAPNHIESGTGRLLLVETARDQAAESGKYTFPAGTVLYSKIRPALAKACIAPERGLCSADMYPIIPSSRLLPAYLLMQLLSETFTDWAVLESMRVAMPKINREALGAFRLLAARRT
jgi:type I restriction enzyme, S subunit